MEDFTTGAVPFSNSGGDGSMCGRCAKLRSLTLSTSKKRAVSTRRFRNSAAASRPVWKRTGGKARIEGARWAAQEALSGN